MESKKDLLILLFIFHHLITGYHGEVCSVINKVTNTGYPSNKIGEWPDGCPNGRYIKAVWSEKPTEHFQKIKCCQGATDNTLSWEFRDLLYLSGGKSNITDQWNVQCQSNAVMTGVRYITKQNGLRILSGIRCSALKYQVFDPNECSVLDFNSPQDPNFDSTTTKPWQHECPSGQAMVGVYDQSDNNFWNIRKAKCCKLLDVEFKPGWESDFSSKFSNLSQSTEDDSDFYKFDVVLPPAIKAEKSSLNTNSERYRIMSPAFREKNPFCLYTEFVIKGLAGIEIKMVDSEQTTVVKKINQRKHGKDNRMMYIRPQKLSMLYIDVALQSGNLVFTKIKVLDIKNCSKENTCTPAFKDCPVNQKCIIQGGLFKCNCDLTRGFYIDNNRKCICQDPKHIPRDGFCVANNSQTTTTTIHSSNGSGRGGGNGFTMAPTVKKTFIEKEVRVETVSEYTYVIAGVLSLLVLVLITVAYYHRNIRRDSRKRNMRSFEDATGMTNMSLGSIDCSLTSVAYNRDGSLYSNRENSLYYNKTSSLYRPFMNSLGSIENAGGTPPGEGANFPSSIINGVVREEEEEDDRDGGVLGSTPEHTPFGLDSETGDPIYTKINRKGTLNSEQYNNLDENANTKKYKQISFDMDEDIFEFEDRRTSTITLLQPNYGYSDEEDNSSDENEESNGSDERFLVPGDDEEELLAGLNQLSIEKVEISTKIIGQGAFGLVKLGKFYSTYGNSNVAVKILKQRAGIKVSQNDRVKFYQEAAIMSQFDHQNVITLFGVIVGDLPCMVLEHMGRGNLWKYLNCIRRLREKNDVTEISPRLHGLFLSMARDIASGMTYLASLNFVHRDLASRNILLDSKYNCKISDFGLSRHFLKDDHYYTSKGGKIPVKWTAPEALNYKKYSTKSDIWSFGIVLWEIWSLGKRPYGEWDNDKVLKEVCEHDYRLTSPDQTPILIYRLMIDCWKTNKNDRPNFNQIAYCLAHKDDQILGSRRKVERTRSITFSYDSETLEHDAEDRRDSSEPHESQTE